MTRREIYSETYHAAMELVSMRLWEEYEAEECFALDVPGEEYPAVATIMGQAGQEYGLTLSRGPDAYRGMCAMFEVGDFDEDVVESVSLLGMSLEPLGNIPPYRREFLDRAGVSEDPSAPVPFFLVKEPGRQARDLNPAEVRSMLYALRGIITAYERGLLEPNYLWESDETLTLIVGGDDPLKPNVLTEWRHFEMGQLRREDPLSAPPEDLWKLPQNDAHLLVGFRMSPMVIDGYEETVWLLVVMEEESEVMLTAEPILAGDVREAARSLFDVFRGETTFAQAGVPSRVTFTNERLSDVLEPALKALGVESRLVDRHPLVEEAWDWMRPDEEPEPFDEDSLLDIVPEDERAHVRELLECAEHFASDVSELMEMEAAQNRPPARPSYRPAEDDLEGWKEWDYYLSHRVADFAMGEEPGPRALSRYFGDKKTGQRWINEEDDTVRQAFMKWYWIDYRSTYRSKTWAEKLLEEDLAEPERRLVEGRLDSHPTIYRIDQIDEEAEELVLEDVLLGGTVRCDHLLWLFWAEDMHFCGRVYPAGDFNFVAMCNPQIARWHVDRVIDYLKGEGMEFTPEGLRENAHLFGHLWELLWEMDEAEIDNIDGDRRRFHTLSYHVLVYDEACEFLADQEDVEKDGNQYLWFRDADESDAGGTGDVVLLARLWFEDEGTLMVETNSEDRVLKVHELLGPVLIVDFDEMSRGRA